MLGDLPRLLLSLALPFLEFSSFRKTDCILGVLLSLPLKIASLSFPSFPFPSLKIDTTLLSCDSPFFSIFSFLPKTDTISYYFVHSRSFLDSYFLLFLFSSILSRYIFSLHCALCSFFFFFSLYASALLLSMF